MGWNWEIRKMKFETAYPPQNVLIQDGRRGNYYYSLFILIFCSVQDNLRIWDLFQYGLPA